MKYIFLSIAELNPLIYFKFWRLSRGETTLGTE